MTTSCKNFQEEKNDNNLSSVKTICKIKIICLISLVLQVDESW
jgi:hypothetical protein